MRDNGFIKFAKIGRLKRTMVITEKIDGTNAQIHIVAGADMPEAVTLPSDMARLVIAAQSGLLMFAGSRNRYITPEADNFGFAKWARDNSDELLALGPGRHYGEWWGSGIQRGYGLTEKRFSLFNTGRWNDATPPPACCHVVPVLKQWTFDTTVIDEVMAELARTGSVAAPGFAKPEGIVIFQAATGTLFKRTLDKDDEHKTLRVSA